MMEQSFGFAEKVQHDQQSLILAIDVGSTSIRAFLYDRYLSAQFSLNSTLHNSILLIYLELQLLLPDPQD